MSTEQIVDGIELLWVMAIALGLAGITFTVLALVLAWRDLPEQENDHV